MENKFIISKDARIVPDPKRKPIVSFICHERSLDKPSCPILEYIRLANNNCVKFNNMSLYGNFNKSFKLS